MTFDEHLRMKLDAAIAFTGLGWDEILEFQHRNLTSYDPYYPALAEAEYAFTQALLKITRRAVEHGDLDLNETANFFMVDLRQAKANYYGEEDENE